MRRPGLVAILVAACGGGGGAATPDAALPTGPISVHAAAGTHVLFRGGDGAVQEIVAGDDGLATAMSTANTSATVLTSSVRFDAFEGLNPGDVVANPLPASAPTRFAAANALVSRYQDAEDYLLQGTGGAYGSIGGTSGTTVVVTIGANDTPSKTDATLVVIATATSGRAYSVVEHADLTGAAIAFPELQPMPAVTITATNVPSSASSFGWSATRYASSDLASPLVVSGFVSAEGSSTHVTLPPVGDTTELRGGVVFADGEIDYDAFGDALAVDASDLPHVGGNAAWIGTKAAWQEDPDGVDPLLAYVTFVYDGVHINVAAPYVPASVELPGLPDTIDTSDTSSIRVTAASTMSFAPGTSYVDALAQLAHPRWRVRILDSVE